MSNLQNRTLSSAAILVTIVIFLIVLLIIVIVSYKNSTQNHIERVELQLDRQKSRIEYLFSEFENIQHTLSYDYFYRKLDIKKIDTIISHRVDSNSFIMDILIIDSDGEIVAWGRDSEPPSIKDRDYFNVHLKNFEDIYISSPMLSKVYTNEWFFASSLGVRDENSTLLGVVAVIVDLKMLLKEFVKDSGEFDLALVNNKNEILFANNSKAPIATLHPIKFGSENEIKVEKEYYFREKIDGLSLSIIANLKEERIIKEFIEEIWQSIILYLLIVAILTIILYKLKRENQKKRHLKELYQKIFEGVSDAIFLIKVDKKISFTDSIYEYEFRFLNANRAYLELLGVDNEDRVLNREIKDIFEGKKYRELLERVKISLKSKDSISYKESVVVNSETQEYITVLNPLINEEGEVYLIAGISRDLSEFNSTIKAEEKLALERKMIEQFARYSDTVFWIRDREKVLYISPAYEKIWERSAQTLYDNPDSFVDIIEQEDKPRVISALQREKELGEIFDETYKIIKNSGEIRYIRAKSYPIRDGTGEITRWTGIAQDVTNEKINEEMLHSFNTRLQERVELELSLRIENERLYKVIFDNSPEGIVVCDKLGVFKKFNRATLELLGYQKSELLEVSFIEISPQIQPENDLFSEVFGKEILNRVLINRDIAQFEWTFVTKQNEERTFFLLISLIDETRDEFLMLLRDIGEIKRLENEKRIQQSILIQQSKLAELGSMIGAIAHQWKQPLNSISLIVQDLPEAYEYGELDEDKIEKTTQEIGFLVDFMSKTVDDFRSFYKPGKIKEEFIPRDEIEMVYRLLKSQLEKRGVVLNINDCRCTCIILGYPSEFKQVILNIINNSKDAFEERGTESPKIDISLDCSDGKNTHIKIEDNGGGIEPSLLPNYLFEMLNSTKGDKGTGIGLSLCKVIVEERLGGKISAYNSQDGAVFDIKIPLFLG